MSVILTLLNLLAMRGLCSVLILCMLCLCMCDRVETYESCAFLNSRLYDCLYAVSFPQDDATLARTSQPALE